MLRNDQGRAPRQDSHYVRVGKVVDRNNTSIFDYRAIDFYSNQGQILVFLRQSSVSEEYHAI